MNPELQGAIADLVKTITEGTKGAGTALQVLSSLPSVQIGGFILPKD